MANLANQKTRDVLQQEQIGRRASIIPEDRNTRAPQLQQYADMRTARRGDGGAAENLMRTLGLVQKAGSDLTNYLQADYAQKEANLIDQGAADQALGRVDPNLLVKSIGYRNAVTKGRTMTEFARAQQDEAKALEEFINQQDNPDLAVRQSEVRDRLEKFYTGFALDPETGQPKAFLQSPDAMRYLSEAISRSRAQFEAGAMAEIEERFNTEAVSHFGQNIVDQARETGTVDLKLALSILPPSVSAEARNAAFVQAAENAANELRRANRPVEAVKLIDSLLGRGVVPMGQQTPTVSPGAPAAPGAAPTANPGRVAFPQLADAVKWAESRGNPGAVSPKGAVGTMQTMPTTLTDPGFGVKPAKDNSPAELERVGRDYLKAMLKRYNGDVVLALAAYNAGPARADAWRDGMKGKTNAQKIAAIPFEETRNYAASILGRLGVAGGTAPGSVTAPDDPIRPNPTFRLTNTDLDPITSYEQTAEVKPLDGVDKLALSPQETARLTAVRDNLANRARQEWKQKVDEERTFNASSMALRLFGQGTPLTQGEISEALSAGSITPQQGMTLFGIMRQNQNQVEAAQDRALAMQDRAQARAREEATSSITGRYIGAILSGRMSAAQARSEVLKELPSIRDPRVQAAVVNSVLASASDIENLKLNSKGVQDRARAMDVDLKDQWRATFANRAYGLPAAQQDVLNRRAEDLIDQMQADFVARVRAGESEDAAFTAATARFGPRLQALTPRPRGGATRAGK